MYSTMFGYRAVSRAVKIIRGSECSAYVLDLLHDVHLVLHLLIQDAVLHELALVELLCRVRLTGELHGHFMYRGESTSANFAHTIVFVRAVPWPWQRIAESSVSLFCTAVSYLRPASCDAVVARRDTIMPWGWRFEDVNLAEVVSGG